LKIVVPAIRKFLKTGATVLSLIKPQFEVGRNRIGKGGVVKDTALHEEITLSLSQFFETIGFRVHGVVPSPITGPKGNKEFLCHMENIS
jgi:23S rRNA (cytidine1920-2'-O)/16S rRNA (cytidine1409-2'-O)-methyltransferase